MDDLKLLQCVIILKGELFEWVSREGRVEKERVIRDECE
jgi:hypothetical protein